MNTLLMILSLIDDDVWKTKGIGGTFERSQLWLAMHHGKKVLEEADAMAERMKNNVDGTGYDVPEKDGKINEDGERVYTWRPFAEHYETEENTSPYINISHTEKFQWACFLLRWMDENEEFHFYMKGNEKVQRYRPSVEEEVAKFLKGDLSEKEIADMDDNLGSEFAERWLAEAKKEQNADYERYGSELIDYINNERCTSPTESPVDWNTTVLLEDTARRLLPLIQRQIVLIPDTYGHLPKWVRTRVWKLMQVEKALIPHYVVDWQ